MDLKVRLKIRNLSRIRWLRYFYFEEYLAAFIRFDLLLNYIRRCWCYIFLSIRLISSELNVSFFCWRDKDQAIMQFCCNNNFATLYWFHNANLDFVSLVNTNFLAMFCTNSSLCSLAEFKYAIISFSTSGFQDTRHYIFWKLRPYGKHKHAIY